MITDYYDNDDCGNDNSNHGMYKLGMNEVGYRELLDIGGIARGHQSHLENLLNDLEVKTKVTFKVGFYFVSLLHHKI